MTETFIKKRPVPLEASGLSGKPGSKEGEVTVDDASLGIFRFSNGGLGSIEASRFVTGRKAFWRIEVYGSCGAIQWDVTQSNILQYFSLDDPLELQGFRSIQVTEPEAHDFIKY